MKQQRYNSKHKKKTSDSYVSQACKCIMFPEKGRVSSTIGILNAPQFRSFPENEGLLTVS